MEITVIVLCIFIMLYSFYYTATNNTIKKYKEYQDNWKKTKYQSDVDYSDRATIVFSNMFNDENITFDL
jgi:hypothetical protein